MIGSLVITLAGICALVAIGYLSIKFAKDTDDGEF